MVEYVKQLHIYVLVHLNRENGGLTYTSAGSKELVLVDIHVYLQNKIWMWTGN